MPHWGQVLQEIQSEAARGAFAANSAMNTVRKKYLLQLHKKTGRNIIAYYSGFLSKPQIRSDINDEDKNGFMMTIHGLDRSKGLDLIEYSGNKGHDRQGVSTNFYLTTN